MPGIETFLKRGTPMLRSVAGLRFGEEYSGNWAIKHKMMERGF
jgi:hypothetical protein